MFVGHYGVALAAKRLSPSTSMGWLFIAVQLLDVFWAPAILMGYEHARIVPGLMPASSLDLYDMPWTHSLAAAMAISWFAFRFSKNVVLGACIMSHWVLDFVAHRPDLPLLRGGIKVGLGLWRYREATFLVEAALLVGGLLVYLGATRAKTAAGKYAMSVLVGVLIVAEIYNLYGPTPVSIRQMAISAEVAYLVFAAIAWRLDLLREPVEHVEERISIVDSGS
jgi:hypothetical protein